MEEICIRSLLIIIVQCGIGRQEAGLLVFLVGVVVVEGGLVVVVWFGFLHGLEWFMLRCVLYLVFGDQSRFHLELKIGLGILTFFVGLGSFKHSILVINHH